MLNEPINKTQLDITLNFYKTISVFDQINNIETSYNYILEIYQIWIYGTSNQKNEIIYYTVKRHEVYMYIIELIDQLKQWSIWFNHQVKGYKQV